jgi:hypothetical protein
LERFLALGERKNKEERFSSLPHFLMLGSLMHEAAASHLSCAEVGEFSLVKEFQVGFQLHGMQ